MGSETHGGSFMLSDSRRPTLRMRNGELSGADCVLYIVARSRAHRYVCGLRCLCLCLCLWKAFIFIASAMKRVRDHWPPSWATGYPAKKCHAEWAGPLSRGAPSHCSRVLGGRITQSFQLDFIFGRCCVSNGACKCTGAANVELCSSFVLFAINNFTLRRGIQINTLQYLPHQSASQVITHLPELSHIIGGVLRTGLTGIAIFWFFRHCLTAEEYSRRLMCLPIPVK